MKRTLDRTIFVYKDPAEQVAAPYYIYSNGNAVACDVWEVGEYAVTAYLNNEAVLVVPHANGWEIASAGVLERMTSEQMVRQAHHDQQELRKLREALGDESIETPSLVGRAIAGGNAL